jgi:CRISPR-associated endonuclease Csn1
VAKLTLGLDVGANSIGWALMDIVGGKTLATGVRVFPEGVDRDQQGGEKSKTQERRTARGTRRQIYRRARRRQLVRQALTSAGLLPTDSNEFQNLLALNPYELRRRALHEKLELHELGRALLHLNQHRGYLSNRKTDKATDKDTQGILAEMNELAAAMQQVSCPTLGSYFAGIEQTYDRCNSSTGPHIRRRHTKREMYEDEFERIWAAQQRYYPDLLTDALKHGKKGKQRFPKKPDSLGKRSNALAAYGVHGLMFFQRKMYWPKSVVGRCELEPKEERCPRAARVAQRFRILQEVNNIRLLDRMTLIERRLDAEQREKVIKRLMESKEVTFDQIRTLLKFPETVRFNLETTRKKLDGHLPDYTLGGKKCLGKRWKELPEETKNTIVDILILEDQEEDAIRRLIREFSLTEEEARRIVKVNFPEGYMGFSRRAIEKLLPHLERGLALMGNDATDSAIHAAGYLRPDERAVNQRQFLPPSPNVANPIVRQAMVEVRKTVNAVLRELVYRQEHTLDEIHVELAREAKKSFAERKQIRFDNSDREKAREDAADRIEKEFNGKIKPTRATVNRYLLWQSQEESCPYCTQRISPEQLFSGEADFDHILPRWRSLDDSMGNKVVAHRRCNQEKGDRTPREWLEGGEPERYEQVLQFAERYLSYGKKLKFAQKDIELKDFVNRQLTDTAYISRCVSQYLQCLGAMVLCIRGGMTSDVRRWWGLNSILQTDGSDKKNRDDHRHHAIDALVIALIDTKRLFALANDRGDNVKPPWPGFRQEAERFIQGTNVSHRVQRRLHGALHKDTFYGATQKRTENAVSVEKRPWARTAKTQGGEPIPWIENRKIFVHRKILAKIKDFKTQDLKKVRDPAIREILRDHLRANGVDPDKPGKIPTGTFADANTPRMKSGVPIKRVRMVENSDTARPVSCRRAFQFVEPRSNHHMIICDLLDKQGKPILNSNGEPKRDGFPVPMMDVAARIARLLREQKTENRKRITLIDKELRGQKKFVMSLAINEMFLLKMPDGSHLLHRIQKLSEGSIVLRPHTYAGKVSDYDKPPIIQRRTPNTLRGEKVMVDRLGRIRRAAD